LEKTDAHETHNEREAVRRYRVVKWRGRSFPCSEDMFYRFCILLTFKLKKFNYRFSDRDFGGNLHEYHEINFEKVVDKRKFYQISIWFPPNGKLQFTVVGNFYEITGSNSGDYSIKSNISVFYSRKKNMLLAHRLWGARWYSLNKRARFQRDYQQFISLIPAVISALEDGISHPKIYQKSAYEL
jgi:hypothetical protein